MLRTLDHVVIVVHDLEAATETYQRLLGRRPSWRGHHEGLGTMNALFRLDNTYVELLSPVAEGTLAAALTQRIEERGEGLVALAFGTDDAGACAVALREHGIAAAEPVDMTGHEMSTGAQRRWRTVHLPEADTRGVVLFAIEHRSPPEALPMADLLGDSCTVVSGIDHAVIMTQDPDASRALYRDRLGLRLALDRSFEERGIRLLFFRVGGITVELAAPLESSGDPTAGDRLWGLSFRVPDLTAACERVTAAGFEVSGMRDGHRPGTRVCTVRRETHGVATLLIGAGAED